MGVIVRKSGAFSGKVQPVQSMNAREWKGIEVLGSYADKINMPITERLTDSNEAWADSSVVWSGYDLHRRELWDTAAGALGSAYDQEKIMSYSDKMPVIRRSRGVVMSGYNFLPTCAN